MDVGPDDPGNSDFLDDNDKIAFNLKDLPVLRDDVSAGTVSIRFYEDMPSVPYISAADFQALILPGSTMTVSVEEGQYLLKNKYASAIVNTAQETFYTEDLMRLTNLMEQVQPGADNVCYDGAAFVRYAYQLHTNPIPITLDYKAYGIDFRGDGENVFLPFCTLADLYSDLYFHYAFCDGKEVQVYSQNRGGNNEALLKNTRQPDMIAYTYSELCFVMDHFYGRPGRSIFEPYLNEIGLDGLLELTTEGKQIKQLLNSDSMTDFAAGMEFLMTYFYDGGHTMTWVGNTILQNPNYTYYLDYPTAFALYGQNYFSPYYGKAIGLVDILTPLRDSLFPEGGTYHKKGDTAICHFDKFSGTDYAAWQAYYDGTGPMPTLATSPNDPFTIFLDALKKADEDPDVKNLVIDLTKNTGGSSDVVVAMTSLMYGDSFFRCINTLTGEKLVWHFDVDRNLDGKFDADDKLVHYNLNFCVLTSKYSFSCGNLFPALCQDAGVLITGETSGGGSCGVGAYLTPEGIYYRLSSYRGRLSDKGWGNIDGGIIPQVSIAFGPDIPYNYQGQIVPFPGYQTFYNLDNLSSIINGYYSN